MFPFPEGIGGGQAHGRAFQRAGQGGDVGAGQFGCQAAAGLDGDIYQPLAFPRILRAQPVGHGAGGIGVVGDDYHAGEGAAGLGADDGGVQVGQGVRSRGGGGCGGVSHKAMPTGGWGAVGRDGCHRNTGIGRVSTVTLPAPESDGPSAESALRSC